MYNVMIFSHAFVVFMHTYHKVTTNSFQKNLTWPNHASPCLWFWKLFNMLLSRIGWEAFDQQWGIWTDFYQNRCIFFSQWSREGARTPPLVFKYLWKYVIKKQTQLHSCLQKVMISCGITSQVKHSEPLNMVLSESVQKIWFGSFSENGWYHLL